MESYEDTLEALNRNLPLRDKLIQTHRVVQKQLPFVARIAVALYDPQTSVLKTYLHSSGEDDPLSHYYASLSEAPSLAKILREGRPRVINNMLTFEGEHEHTRRIGRQGYAASYTMPIFNNGAFVGFIFFNSYERDIFTESVLNYLDVFGHLISLMVVNELTATRTLTAAVKTTSHFTHVRDVETGSHVDRMSRYARLIARELATRHELDDDYIEHVFMYSPLHDIGKIAIPDRILFKPGRLDAEEGEIMRSHARKGREILDEVLANFGLDAMQHVNILRNIAEHHHEAMNGEGYPAASRAATSRWRRASSPSPMCSTPSPAGARTRTPGQTTRRSPRSGAWRGKRSTPSAWRRSIPGGRKSSASRSCFARTGSADADLRLLAVAGL